MPCHFRLLHAAVIAACLAPSIASAHEFWLDPVEFTPKVGTSVPIVHRNGQNFLGDSFPFIRQLTRKFVLIDGRGERPIKALEGDDPAAEVRFTQPGLGIVAYHRGPERVVHPTLARFEENLVEEGLEALLAEHRAAGRPATNIAEIFWRCAKALVQVGGRGGNDRAVGLPIEIVAERNPYDLDNGATLPVRILRNGAPAAGLLLKVFNRNDPASPARLRADAEGRVVVPLGHKGEYLLSTVAMVPAAAADKADWVSYWASTTFERK